MSDILLKRGQTADITFALVDNEGAPFDLTGYTVSLVIAGRSVRLQLAATLDSPATLGTGAFRIDAADYAALKPGADVPFELWAVSSTERTPFLSGVLRVVDVPQVTT